MSFDPMMEPGMEGGMMGEPEVAPLFNRPALEADFNVPGLKPERRDEIGMEYRNVVDRYLQSTDRRRKNGQLWWWAYRQMPADGVGPAFEGGSQLEGPITRICCDNHMVRLNQSVLGADPPFSPIAKKPEVIPLLPQLEEIQSPLLEEAGWRDAVRDTHKLLSIYGNAAVRVTWEQDKIRVPRLKTDWDVEHTLALAAVGVEPEIAIAAGVKTDAQGRAKVTVEHEEKMVRDGVRLKVIHPDDLILLPLTARHKDDLWGGGEVFTLTGSTLQRGIKSKLYLKETGEQLLKLPSDVATDEEENRADASGVDPSLDYEDRGARFREWRCAELCVYDDLDDDGEEEWYVLAIHLASGLLVRCQYMSYEHGRNYYVPVSYIRNPGQITAEGIAELVAQLQDAMTAGLNQIFDLGSLMVGSAGNILYEPGALEIDRYEFRPGMPMPVNNVTGIKEMTFAQGIPAAIGAMQGLIQYIKELSELVTASSNPALGRETDTQKTLGEVQAVMGQAMQIFEDHAGHVALAWAEVWDQVRWLYAQFGPGGQVQYRRSPQAGVTEFGMIDATTLTADVDWVPAGLNQFADAQFRLQQATAVQETLLAHPLTMQNPEVWMTALDAYLQAFRYPQREQIMASIQKQMMMQAQQAALQAEIDMAMGEQQGAGMAREAQMADEQHAEQMAGAKLGNMGAAVGVAQQVRDYHTPPKNGKKNGNR